jgi:hypothetical protein
MISSGAFIDMKTPMKITPQQQENSKKKEIGDKKL